MKDKDIEEFIEFSTNNYNSNCSLFGDAFVYMSLEIAKELLKLRQKYDELWYDYYDN